MAEIKRLSLSGSQEHRRSKAFEGRVYGDGPRLEFDKDTYLLKDEDQFKVIQSSEVVNKDTFTRSLTALEHTLEECSGAGLFALSDAEHLSGCLVLDYIIETVGSNTAFWDLATRRPELLQQFVDYIWVGTDMKSAINSVKPVYDLGYTGTGPSEAVFVFNLTADDRILCELGFAEDEVRLTLPSRAEVRQWHTTFPAYQKWKTPCLSFRKYLFLMWTHLWRQLAGACGIYSNGDKFEDVACDPETVHIWATDDFYGVTIYNPGDVEEYFRENWLDKSLYTK